MSVMTDEQQSFATEYLHLALWRARKVWNHPEAQSTAHEAICEAAITWSPSGGSSQASWVLYITELRVIDAQRRWYGRSRTTPTPISLSLPHGDEVTIEDTVIDIAGYEAYLECDRRVSSRDIAAYVNDLRPYIASERHMRILEMRMHGHSLKEIAEVFDVTESAISYNLRTIRKRYYPQLSELREQCLDVIH